MTPFKIAYQKQPAGWILLWCMTAGAIYILDINIPLGVADGMLYVALILLGLLAGERRLIISGGILGTFLIVLGFFFSSPDIETWKGVTNRFLSVFTLWVTTLLCYLQNNSESELATIQEQLEKRVRDRTAQLDKTNLLLRQESSYVQLHKDIAAAANETCAVEDTLQYCLKRICDHAQWPVGHLYMVDESSQSKLVSSNIWYLENPEQFETFRTISEATAFDTGIGLPGRVLSSGKPAWIIDVTEDANFPRAKLVTNLGVKAGFAFPILIGHNVVGIMEFFSTDAAEPKHEMLEIMAHIGTHLGRVIERQKSEKDQDRLLNFLRQKVNEQTCLYNVANLITHSSTLPEVFRQMESQIAPALRFPEQARVRVTFEGNHFISKEFVETPWSLSSTLEIHEEPHGRLEVFYTEAPHFKNEPVFLEEEKDLIDALARLLSIAAQRKKAEEEIDSSHQHLRKLYHRMNHVREEERTRIAREIHDELAQVLTALKLEISVLNKKLNREISLYQPDAERLLGLIDQTIPTVKQLILDLRPPMLDDLGLHEAILWQGQEFEKRTGIRCKVLVENQELVIDKDRATTLFRIFQEIITNVVRHAQASEITVQLAEENQNLILEVRDNGIGIRPEQLTQDKSLGILGIRERVRMWGGDVDIQGIPEKGTTVKITIQRS